MKTLVIDIETTPFLSYHFKQWKTDIYPGNVVKAPEVLCFAWKWHDEPGPVNFEAGNYHPTSTSRIGLNERRMAQRAYDLLCTADAIVTFNGDNFDLGYLHGLVDKYNLGPPSPYKSIDLRKVVKRQFKFAYNSLDYVCSQLGIGTKLKHPGLQMWIDCMDGDPKAWVKMQRYCKHDVRLTDGLFRRELPWIHAFPTATLVDGVGDQLWCPRCESNQLVRQGYRHLRSGTYPRYQCKSCKGWSQGTRRVDSTGIVNAT